MSHRTTLFALLAAGCSAHVVYAPPFDADGGIEGVAEGVDGGDGLADAAPDELEDGECEPGDLQECQPPYCDGMGRCLGAQWCDNDGLWGECMLCPPGLVHPTDEICGDAIDNDCDGFVDECEEQLCTLCQPLSFRWCDDPDYSSWGRQQCRADGEWGPCTEAAPPEPCERFSWYSPEAEVCLIEQGECGQDMWDLDHDGDTWESLGDCPDPLCVE